MKEMIEELIAGWKEEYSHSTKYFKDNNFCHTRLEIDYLKSDLANIMTFINDLQRLLKKCS